MNASATSRLYMPGSSAVHRLAPQCKLAAMLLFVFAVVATRREAIWAFAAHALVLVAVIAVARLPVGVVLRRLTIETPFVIAAVVLPFVAGGRRIDVGFASLSVEGLWGAWGIVAKGTLGVGAAVVLTATTTVPDMIGGLRTLRCPPVITSIASFMVRYADVIGDDLRRMRIARISRADDPRWFWQAKAVASTAGTLFVRTYERGERVHLAMLARGYDGTFVQRPGSPATARRWIATLTVPAVAALLAAASLVLWR